MSDMQGRLRPRQGIKVRTSNKYLFDPNLVQDYVKDGTLTIQKNGSTVATFTANQEGDSTANLIIPTTPADIGALPDSTTIADLATTAQLAAVNSGATATKIGQITTNQNAIGTLSNLTTAAKTDLVSAVNEVDGIASTALQPNDNISSLTNDSGYITGITSGDVTTALGYTPADSASLATVATTGDYDDLTNKPTIPTVNNATLTITQGGVSKGTFTANASSDVTIALDAGGTWGSITGTLSNQTDLANALAAKYDASNPDGFISGITSSDVTTALGYTPVNPSGLATVATSGDYDDLTNKPTIPTVNNATLTIQKNGTDVQTFTANASSNVTANITVPTKTSDLTNDDGFISGITSSDVTTALGYTPVNPSGLATVAMTGDYNDLTNKPTIPAAQVNSDWNANSGVAEILNKPTLGTMAAESASDYTKTSGLAAVALSGAYSDLSGKPSLATVATSGDYDDLTNKPTLASVATSGSYNDLSNKPTIPTVNDATITLTQSGITKGSFTLNQSANSTIELDGGLLTNVADVVGTYAELQAYSTTNLPSGSIVEVMVDENNSNKHSYYRWNDGQFVQPALTADGTIGGDSFACDMDSRYSSEVHYACWRAFDGRTVFNQYRQAITADGQPHWIEFYNPVPLVVTKMTVYNGYDTSLPLAWQFQCSDDNTTWTTIASGTNTNYTQGSAWSFDVSNSGYHKYYRFYTTSGYGTNSGTLAISEFVITGHISGWTLVADEGPFTPTWGSITGTLSDQTDLANALAAKYDASNPSGYTSNVGTVTSVNNTSPDGNGNVTLSIPATTNSVTSGSSAALTSGGAYTALQSYATTSAIANMQTTTNLVTSVSSSSTDSQYPSALCLYTLLGDVESLINAL